VAAARRFADKTIAEARAAAARIRYPTTREVMIRRIDALRGPPKR
jgi:hypothetical protein